MPPAPTRSSTTRTITNLAMPPTSPYGDRLLSREIHDICPIRGCRGRWLTCHRAFDSC
jgi:hypothetical protein